MSLFGDYIKEKDGKCIYETNLGFITYEFLGEACYIEHIYVVPSARRDGIGSEMADHVSILAKSKGCKFLTGTVRPSAIGSTDSTLALIEYGFKLMQSQNDAIYFAKEL